VPGVELFAYATQRSACSTSIDAYVRYKVSQDGLVSVRGFNLGDDREAPIFGYPSVGRRIVVELSTR
jgi:hypothetical protein